ncbi:MAG: hypothetical protein CML17_12885 [Pusillimonas sp.]|jgi:ABC-type branched-subunit amino acid transport system ATPase component|nr:hypothetical protein [Pusillimonas sp.]
MLLDIDNLSAGHGDAIALHEVSLQVPEGQSVAVLGRNGAGKTTLLETVMGPLRSTRMKICRRSLSMSMPGSGKRQ